MTRPRRLVLGSGSPRRHELLAQIGFAPDEVRVPDIDETPLPGEVPLAYCRRIAAAKAAAIPLSEGEVLLVGDTTVALGRRILGKPADAGEARAFLTALGGRRHRVISAIVVRTGGQSWARSSVATVRMKRLGAEELDAYVASEEWRGKAGGYGIQGRAAAFIPWIEGSYSAIVGLPLTETAALLTAAGLRPGRSGA